MTDMRATTLKVVRLLDQSWTAFERGDVDECKQLMEQAVTTDPDVFVAIRGGMTIGAIPTPEHDPEAWADFINHSHWDAADAEEICPGCQHCSPPDDDSNSGPGWPL